MRKVYVDMTVNYTKEGEIFPLSFIWEDETRYIIDRVFDNKRVASLKVGGQGIRYRCRIMGKEVYVFLEDGRWFIEGK